MQNRQMPLDYYRALGNLMLAQNIDEQMPRGTGFREQGGYAGKVYNTPDTPIEYDPSGLPTGRSEEYMKELILKKAQENKPIIPPTSNRPVWRHSDGTPATAAEIHNMFGKDLKENPNVPIGERGIDFNAIRNNPNRRKNMFNELDGY